MSNIPILENKIRSKKKEKKQKPISPNKTNMKSLLSIKTLPLDVFSVGIWLIMTLKQAVNS